MGWTRFSNRLAPAIEQNNQGISCPDGVRTSQVIAAGKLDFGPFHFPTNLVPCGVLRIYGSCRPNGTKEVSLGAV